MRPLLTLKTYVWIVNMLKMHGPIDYEGIKELWDNSDISDNNGMSKKTFIRYKKDIEEFFGVMIEYDSFYRYYVSDYDPLHKYTVADWMLDSLEVNDALAYNKEVQRRIILEPIPTTGRLLKDIVESITKGRELEIIYQRYESTKERRHRLKPYFVKLYHQRWYLLGLKDDGTILTFALDRIKSIAKTSKRFRFDKRIKAKDYFEGCYGVMKDETKPVERIVLRAYGYEANYLRDLKLHSSQMEIATNDDYSDFELRLRPSMDFRGKLMERGSRIKVMEPEHLAKELMEEFEKSVKIYKE